MTADSTTRFSSRVQDYIKYRPTYPTELLGIMAKHCGLNPRSIVADLGSGTGILSELLLKNGNAVFGVEPNAEMRAAGEKLLAGYPGFMSVPATAEATTLADASIDFITAGQAFHWFDRVKARQEFARILKPDGWMVLVWNDRRLDSTQFLREYEVLLQRYGTDYAAVRHQDLDLQQVRAFVGWDAAEMVVLENTQQLDFEGLRGRLLSSSYTPEADHPSYASMLGELEEIFRRGQVNGRVAFEYETKIYFAQLPR
jgi:SAM-dependent methyltransferase